MKKRNSNTPIMQSAKKTKFQNANQTMLEDAKIVVGIDFGTTFSGFAYATKSNPERVLTFYDWPCQAAAGAKPYCKTQTSLWYLPRLYTGGFDLKDWGWPAQVNHCQALQANWNSYVKATADFSSPALRRSNELSTCGHFLTKFKLFLSTAFKGEKLPKGLSTEQIISDYLQQLSTFIMCELNKSGRTILKKDVQWCLTVPTIWTDAAKQTMIDCSQMAGLVIGPHCRDKDASLHQMLIVLEPEAASLYCLQKLKDTIHFRKGSKFLVVDAGGGTVDVVLHEKVDDTGLRVKEVTCSTGNLCGGSFVDEAFMDFLARKIECLEKFSAQYPTKIFRIKRDWEDFKCCFDGKGDPYVLDLPPKLAVAWETHEKNHGDHEFLLVKPRYDELIITTEDMKSIFDGQVNKVIKLIKYQLMQVPKVEAIMVVGGFSNSPYLMKRIRDECSHLVKQIVSPPDPGSAICQGAVTFGALGADIMMSRKSRKTYGMCMYREFQQGDPKGSLTFDDKGEALCKDSFCIFTRIGEDVPVDHCVTHCDFVPVNKGERSIEFTMYSTSAPEPKFVTDRGVVKVGSWLYPLPAVTRKMKDKPCVDVTFFFGRTRIEVSAQPRNFKGGKTSLLNVLFERDLD